MFRDMIFRKKNRVTRSSKNRPVRHISEVICCDAHRLFIVLQYGTILLCRFYNAICPFQANISSDDDVISREYVTLRHHAPGAADSQSVDSGIDLQSSVRVSSASMDSDVSALSRASLQSADSTVECGITEAMLATSQSQDQASEPGQPTGGVTSPDKDICDDHVSKTPTEATKSTEV